jgi:hypothetical protein
LITEGLVRNFITNERRGWMIVKGEALIRLEAERRLLDRYRKEYERLTARHEHVRAVLHLVKTHKRAYDDAVRAAREHVRSTLEPRAA